MEENSKRGIVVVMLEESWLDGWLVHEGDNGRDGCLVGREEKTQWPENFPSVTAPLSPHTAAFGDMMATKRGLTPIVELFPPAI